MGCKLSAFPSLSHPSVTSLKSKSAAREGKGGQGEGRGRTREGKGEQGNEHNKVRNQQGGRGHALLEKGGHPKVNKLEVGVRGAVGEQMFSGLTSRCMIPGSGSAGGPRLTPGTPAPLPPPTPPLAADAVEQVAPRHSSITMCTFCTPRVKECKELRGKGSHFRA